MSKNIYEPLFVKVFHTPCKDLVSTKFYHLFEIKRQLLQEKRQVNLSIKWVDGAIKLKSNLECRNEK